MAGLNYNYVFFNVPDNKLKKDKEGYYYICTADLENHEDIKVVSYPLDYANFVLRRIFWIHHSEKINRIINLPLKKIWYPYYFCNDFNSKKPICFIHSGTYATLDYMRYLKKKFPTAKFVKVYRDLTKIFHQMLPEFTESAIREIFDIQFSIDEKECQNLDMIHFDEFESKIELNTTRYKGKYDIFFAGKAKDRLPLLMDVYHRLTNAGLKCNYYLTEVPIEQQIPYEGIEYSKKKISYKEMVERTIAAKCVLEINQQDAAGYTSRFLEAVMYNRKLITNNFSVKKSKFYNEQYIRCFEKASEIDPAFVYDSLEKIDYGYNGEFSPLLFIKQIDDELTERFLK